MLALLLGGMTRGAPGRGSLPSWYTPYSVGYDVSWPNCTQKPPADTSWGVVGVTGGLSFKPNPCMATEATWFKQYALYINTGYPGRDRALRYAHTPQTCPSNNEFCLAYNYGYNAAYYAVRLASQQNMHASWWWLDVETANSWSDDPLVNRASLMGAVAAVRHDTLFAHIGYYAYPGQWDLITGKWDGAGLPAWVATGSARQTAATKACLADSFTTGKVVLGQYVQRLDRNLVCAGPG